MSVTDPNDIGALLQRVEAIADACRQRVADVYASASPDEIARIIITAEREITALLGEVRARSSSAATEAVIRELLARLVAGDRVATDNKERLIRAVLTRS